MIAAQCTAAERFGTWRGFPDAQRDAHALQVLCAALRDSLSASILSWTDELNQRLKGEGRSE